MTGQIPNPTHKPNRQALYVVIAIVLGAVAGGLLNITLADQGTSRLSPVLAQIIALLNILADVFFRLIKMIIAPLVFSTLVVGMTKIGNVQTLGQIGARAIVWFLTASIFCLCVGMLLANLFEPGSSVRIILPVDGTATSIPATVPTLGNFVAHVFPKSIIEAMAANEILQIVVFSMFFGVACASLGELAQPLVKSLDSLTHIMLKITGYVMKYAPVAVFSAIASVMAQHGIGMLLTYGKLIGEFYFGLLLLWSVLGFAGYMFLGRDLLSLLRHIREPVLLAFGTSSSESAYPKLLQQLERFGCDEKVCRFVLPLGYSFNLNGSMLYLMFSVLFITQAYGIDMTLGEQLVMLLVLLFTSKGVAGMPRASLTVIASTLTMFHIPEAGLLLLLGVDQILDMGRSATNVLGNGIAATAVSRWQKKAG
ncbi:MAG: dicarboxylate/amino acid:cation symporter [Gammaproteobacteria bacterium]|nr:dicarboxylate/amino acid:cation symporter [Gammaproteobacteria bacterium]